jgi:hypothetical protein
MRHSSKRCLAFTAVTLLTIASASSQESFGPDSQVQGVTISGSILIEDSCEVLASSKGQKAELREVPGLHALDRTEARPLAVPSTPDVKISGVMCWRSEARLAPNDYLVGTTTGLSLYIKTDTGDQATDRTIALEYINGGFRVRLLSGPDWTPSEEEEMKEAMAQFNKRARAAPSKSLERTREG